MSQITKHLTLALVITVLCQIKAFATNKAVIHIGPSTFKAHSISDQTVNGQTSINVTKSFSTSGHYDPHLTIKLPADFFANVGSKNIFELTDISFSGLTKFKFETDHFESKDRLASNSDTLIKGSLKVVSYNPETKIIHFTIKAIAKPYSKSFIEFITGENPYENEPVSINKSIQITANITASLSSL